MDVVDIRILRHMGWRPFEAGARGPDAIRAPSIARALRVNVDTVKFRVRKLESAGVIRGYEIHPNLRLLGLRHTTLHFHVAPERKKQVLKDIEPLEGVACVYNFLQDDFCVDIYHRPGADFNRRVKLLETLTGSKAFRFYVRPSPSTALHPTRLDWRILRALRGRALLALSDVAAELGVSARTAKRRFERMETAKAFDMGPILDPSRIQNFIPVSLNCRYVAGAGPGPTQRLLRAFDERLLYSWRPTSAEIGDYEVFVYARTMAEIEDLRAQAAAIPGIEQVTSMLPVYIQANATWVNAALDERAEARAGTVALESPRSA